MPIIHSTITVKLKVINPKVLPAASPIETVLVFIALSSRRGHWNYLHIEREEKPPLFSLPHSGRICPGQRRWHVVIRNHVHIKRWSLDPTCFSSCFSIVWQSLWFRRQERSILDGILTSLWRFPRRWSSTSWFSGHDIEHLTSKSELAFNHFLNYYFKLFAHVVTNTA